MYSSTYQTDMMCFITYLLTVEELAGLYCIGSEHAANFLYDLSRLS